MMNPLNIQINDTVYLFKEDPKCETVYEVMDIHKDGRAVLFHPVLLQTEAYVDDIQHSIY